MVALLNLPNDEGWRVADRLPQSAQLGITDEIGDSAFDKGMLADAQTLGDQGTTSSSGVFTPDWIPAFKHDIHGLLMVSGERNETVEEKLEDIRKIFSVGAHDATMHEVLSIVGDVRPGKEAGHEQFVSGPLKQNWLTADELP